MNILDFMKFHSLCLDVLIYFQKIFKHTLVLEIIFISFQDFRFVEFKVFLLSWFHIFSQKMLYQVLFKIKPSKYLIKMLSLSIFPRSEFLVHYILC